MARAVSVDEPLEIESITDLRRAIREVQAHNETLIIHVGEAGTAILSPPKRKARRTMTPEERKKADDEAFLSSAGALEGLFDPEEFKGQYKAARGSKRPLVVIDLPEESTT